MRTNIWRRLATAAMRLYPASWRARYGDEVEALVDASPPGPRLVADLAFGAIRQRSAALGVLVWFAAVLVRAFVLMMAVWLTLAILFVLIVGPIESIRLGFDWSEWASRRIVDVPYSVTAGLPMWFFFSTQFSLPLLLLWPPIRRRHPVLARILFTAAFSGFSVWLGHLNQLAAMLFCGWLIAVKVFPIGAPTSAPAAANATAPPVPDSDLPPAPGLHRSTVTT